MSPPTATETANVPILDKGAVDDKVDTEEDQLAAVATKGTPAFPSPKKFDDPYKERAYLKGRLIVAYRMFAMLGYDEGVAGHITIRVSTLKLIGW